MVVQRKAEFQEHYATGAVYVLNMAWFREWENFVCCKTDGLCNYLSCSMPLPMIVGGRHRVFRLYGSPSIHC